MVSGAGLLRLPPVISANKVSASFFLSAEIFALDLMAWASEAISLSLALALVSVWVISLRSENRATSVIFPNNSRAFSCWAGLTSGSRAFSVSFWIVSALKWAGKRYFWASNDSLIASICRAMIGFFANLWPDDLGLLYPLRYSLWFQGRGSIMNRLLSRLIIDRLPFSCR